MKRIPFIEDVLVLLNSSHQDDLQLLFFCLVEVVEVPDIVLDQAKNISDSCSQIDFFVDSASGTKSTSNNEDIMAQR